MGFSAPPLLTTLVQVKQFTQDSFGVQCADETFEEGFVVKRPIDVLRLQASGSFMPSRELNQRTYMVCFSF
jgi:hypothetical protein